MECTHTQSAIKYPRLVEGTLRTRKNRCNSIDSWRVMQNANDDKFLNVKQQIIHQINYHGDAFCGEKARTTAQNWSPLGAAWNAGTHHCDASFVSSSRPQQSWEGAASRWWVALCVEPQSKYNKSLKFYAFQPDILNSKYENNHHTARNRKYRWIARKTPNNFNYALLSRFAKWI